jgi:transcription antitermination factor NusG
MSTEFAISMPRWFAAYTRSNHERSAADQLAQRSIAHFVPTYESVRVWKDRKKRLERPLFPGYVFVRVPLEEKLRVLVVPGIVRLVGFDGHPLPVPDEEIETLRTVVQHKLKAEPHPYLVAGRKVRIVRGALEGMEGILIRKKGRLRVLVSINLIRQSAMIEVDAHDVEPIFEGRVRSAPADAVLRFVSAVR